MPRAIRSYLEGERQEVVDRRIKNNAGGIGTLAAEDYQRRKMGLLWKQEQIKKHEEELELKKKAKRARAWEK